MLDWDGDYGVAILQSSFWDRNDNLMRCIPILAFEDSMFVFRIGECHRRSKTRYKGRDGRYGKTCRNKKQSSINSSDQKP